MTDSSVATLETHVRAAVQALQADEAEDAHRMLAAVTRVQRAFLTGTAHHQVFELLLEELLRLGESSFGLIGEVERDEAGAPYLRALAISNIAWDDHSRALHARSREGGVEFRDPDSLLGEPLRTGQPVITADAASDPRRSGLPPGHPPLAAYVGIPFAHDAGLVGMVALANRADGYSEAWLRAMDPLLETVRTVIVAHRSDRERQRMHARAETAERRLVHAVEALEDGFVLYDSDDRLALCNGRYRDIYRHTSQLMVPGVRFEELIREGVRRGQYPEANGREEEWIAQRMAAHRRADSVIEQRLPDGRWLRIAERRTADGGTVGFRVDITALKDAALKLERMNALSAAAGRIARLGSWEIDLGSGRVTWSDTTYAIHELTEGTVLFLDQVLDYYVPEHRALIRDAFLRCTSEGEPWDLELQVESCRGRRLWVRTMGEPVYEGERIVALRGVMQDIDERKHDEQRLRTSQSKFEAAFRNAADCMGIVSGTPPVVLEVNLAFERLTGFAPEEAIGRPVGALGLWADETDRKAVRRMLRDGRPIENLPALIRRKDDQIRHVLLSAARIVVDDQPCVLWTVRDVSERVAAEEESRRLTARLQASVGALETVNRQNTQLSELRDMLQTCLTVEEVQKVAAYFVPRLLPGSEGALYRRSDGPDGLEAAFTWGESEVEPSAFEPDDCWAVRRGRPYQVSAPEDALACRHVSHVPKAGYICAPVGAQGDSYGLLHVRFATPAEGEAGARREEFVRAMTEHIGLAISHARLREHLHRQASRDPLTGLANRRHMEETLERALGRCRHSGRPLSLMMVDVDRFKQFNDDWGHDAGDLVLKRVGRALVNAVRSGDTVCRYGGEEFLILMGDADIAVASARAEQAREAVAALSLQMGDTRLPAVTVSIGVASFPTHADSLAALVRASDAAMYAAKRAGRNRVMLAGATGPAAATRPTSGDSR